MKVKYYGTRGSIPTPGKDTIIYGGNTPCVKVETETTLIILDCGTGLKKLGDELMSTEFSKGKGEVHIFISHFHWDHIQGVPFFAPAYLAGNSIFFYGGKNVNQTIEEVLIKQQEYINFPVELGELPAIIRFIELTDGQEINIKDVNIKARKLNHPGGVFGFRIENKGKVLVYATDTEHFSVLDWRLLDLAKGADILIYDSAFSPEEYEKGKKVGWGHSTYAAGIDIVKAANVKEFHMFHHDPSHSDQFLESMLEKAKKLFKNVKLAKEGDEYIL